VKCLTEDEFEQFIRDRSGLSDYKLSQRDDVLKALGEDDNKSPVKLRKSLTIDEEGNIHKNTEMWTDLYKPETIRDLVGNEGAVN